MSNTETPAEAGKQAKTVQVKIIRKEGHRHAGQLHAQAAVIPVSVRDAEIIVDRLKAGERVKGN